MGLTTYAPFPAEGLDDPAWQQGFNPATALTLNALSQRERELLATRIRLGEPVCRPNTPPWKNGGRLVCVRDMNLVIGAWYWARPGAGLNLGLVFAFWGSGHLPPVVFEGLKPTRAKVAWLGARLLQHLEGDAPLPFGWIKSS